MLSSLKNALGDKTEGDIKGKLLAAIDPVISEHWPKIAPLVEQYTGSTLDLAQNDVMIEKLARNLYPWLPALVRMVIKEEAFIVFMLEHKTTILNKITEMRSKPAASAG